MASQYPSINDHSFDLLKKIANNTAELTDGGGTFLTQTEGDARYLQLTGGTVSGRLTINTGVSTPPAITSSGILNLIGASGVQQNMFRSSADNSGPSLAFFKDRAAGTAVQSGDELGYIDFRGGYGTSLFNRGALIYSLVDGAPSGTNIPGRIEFWTNSVGGLGIAKTILSNYGKLSQAPANGSLAAWGVTGVIFSQGSAIYTDTSSAGTVATAVANSHAVPTFAASSATTFTDAANLYIAGGVAAGTNVTLTNSYGLWNVGKTRLDGAVQIGSAVPTNLGGAGTLNITGGVIYNHAAGFAPTFYGLRVNGTIAAPTAVTSGQSLININAGGYKATAYSLNAAGIASTASENWTDSATGSRIWLYTTPNGSVTNAVRLMIEQDGAVQIPSTSTPGIQLYNTADQTTNYERMSVKWDGTYNRVISEAGGSGTARPLRLEHIQSGANTFLTLNTGDTTSNFRFSGTARSSAAVHTLFIPGIMTNTSGTTVTVSIAPTYNQASGTAANTDLLINRTQTAVGSGAQLLIDAQVGSVSKFSVNNVGAIAIGNTVAAGVVSASTHKVTIAIGGVTYYLLASDV